MYLFSERSWQEIFMQIGQMESIKTFGKCCGCAGGKSQLLEQLCKCCAKANFKKKQKKKQTAFVVKCIVNYFGELSLKGYFNFLHYLVLTKQWVDYFTFFFFLHSMLCTMCCATK